MISREEGVDATYVLMCDASWGLHAILWFMIKAEDTIGSQEYQGDTANFQTILLGNQTMGRIELAD